MTLVRLFRMPSIYSSYEVDVKVNSLIDVVHKNSGDGWIKISVIDDLLEIYDEVD